MPVTPVSSASSSCSSAAAVVQNYFSWASSCRGVLCVTLCVSFGSHHNTAVLGLEPAHTHRVAQWGRTTRTDEVILSRCPVVAIRMTYDNVSILSPPRRGVALIMLEPIPSAANIAALAVAIFACMHVCRIPPYVVGRLLRFLACDVSPGVLIRTGSNASSIIDESTKLKPETHLDIYRHTVGCGTRATSTRRWRRGGGEEKSGG